MLSICYVNKNTNLKKTAGQSARWQAEGAGSGRLLCPGHRHPGHVHLFYTGAHST